MNDEVYLQADTKLEPLCARWYAWGHLVSPVQQALCLAFRQVPGMQSFLANASVHERATKDPKMFAGAFMELTQASVPAVRSLLARTQDRHADLLHLAQELLSLDRRLQKETGQSLDSFYQAQPPVLGGLVEMLYDLNHHARFRILEELAYEAGWSNQASQEISLTRMRDETRNFFLNTPLLEDDTRLTLPVSFKDPRIDLLSQARLRATPFAELAAAFNVPEQQRGRFRSYFTDEPPERQDTEFHGDGVRVRYFGHACVLIQTDQVSVLIDPFVTWDDYPGEAHLSFDDLPDRIDWVFLTHNHQDHFSVELLLQLRRRIGRILVPRNNPNCMADPSMRLALESLGFDSVQIMDWMDAVAIPGGAITSIPFYGEHADLDIASKHGMHLRIKDRTFLFLADSDCKDPRLYQRVVDRLGKVDTLFIGMECDGAPLNWLYGCYFSGPINRKDNESRRLSGSDATRALEVVKACGCKTAYVYAMGQEPWMRFVTGLQYTPGAKQIVESDKFVEACHRSGLVSERLYGGNTWVL